MLTLPSSLQDLPECDLPDIFSICSPLLADSNNLFVKSHILVFPAQFTQLKHSSVQASCTF